jgi:hypothetical protein
MFGMDNLGFCAPPPMLSNNPPHYYASLPMDAALLIGKRWPEERRTLGVGFVEDASPEIIGLIIGIISGPEGWNSASGLQFVFGRDNPEIRIAFSSRGSWSYVGMDALDIPASAPTMNLGWLTPALPYSDARQVVLHEFGHAVGMIHEHNSPRAHIPWNEPAVIEYYMCRHGWSEARIRDNILAPAPAENGVAQTVYDSTSIMHYMIPPELLTDPNWRASYNTTLSAEDRRLAAEWYGPPPARWRGV